MADKPSVAPTERINISYETHGANGKKTVELPNKMLVIGDFTMREDEQDIEKRDRLNVNKDNFNQVMESQKLSLTFNVNDTLSDSKDAELPVTLKFDDIRSFDPDEIAKQVEPLQKLVALRDALTFLKGPLGNVSAFRKQIDAMLNDEESKAQLMKELGMKD